MKSESQNRTDAVGRPLLTSYDSGYEHSLDHWIELQHLVREAEDGFPPLAVEANRLTSSGYVCWTPAKTCGRSLKRTRTSSN
jgi:hypothetical protein